MKCDALKTTPLHDWHVATGARMVEFSGWHMPLHYAGGIIREHLQTRRTGGLFDISHMGRFRVSGPEAVGFLRHVLTNDAATLATGESHYTMLADRDGCAVDDAYLFHWRPEDYVLIVNAGNLVKDWRHLQSLASDFDVAIEDFSPASAMIAVQGPESRSAIEAILVGELPAAKRNALSLMSWRGTTVYVGRTGYTGEPIGYEIILDSAVAVDVWQALVASGLSPIGLGARDTLRLEAGLPLYGHEFGEAPDGRKIPIFASPLARFAVKSTPERGDFIGREALLRQMDQGEGERRRPSIRRIVAFAIDGRGIARAGDRVLRGDRAVGWVTSGTMVPYWKEMGGSGGDEAYGMRAIGLALVEPEVEAGDELAFDVRGKRLSGIAVKRHLANRQPPYALPILI